MDNLFSTHPNTENRIAALQAMAAEFDGGRSGPASRQTRSAPEAGSGPWGGGVQPEPARAPEPRQANPWGRNPTGPRGRRS